MLNQCNFIGRLGNDPELKFLPTGDAVVNISIAVSEKWKDKQGQKQEKTEWIRCTAFKRQAEVIGEYLKKGSLVHITGKFTTRKWDNKEGVTQYSTEIVIQGMQMLDSRSDNQGGQSSAPSQEPEPQVQKVDNSFDEGAELDIPF
jgi:single-strand DNA-binding protein